MKARNFRYIRPSSLEEACRILADGGGDAVPLAGGQSLLAGLNMRLSAPKLLVDIGDLKELTGQTHHDGVVRLGALTRHAELLGSELIQKHVPLLTRAAAHIGHVAIRNRGTLGGSLALSDPAAEWPAVLVALDAEAVLYGPGGRRSLKCREFINGIYETKLADCEIIESVRIPKLSASARCGYLKLCRKSGEFANALAVAVADHARGYCRVVSGAANGAPLVLTQASQALVDNRREPEALRGAIAADLDHAADRHFDDFQHNLLMVAAMRAVREVTA